LTVRGKKELLIENTTSGMSDYKLTLKRIGASRQGGKVENRQVHWLARTPVACIFSLFVSGFFNYFDVSLYQLVGE
jgi:hypothetical protein